MIPTISRFITALIIALSVVLPASSALTDSADIRTKAEMYQYIIENRGNENYLESLDSFRNICRRSNDTVMESVALSFMVSHYSTQDNEAALLEKAAEAIRYDTLYHQDRQYYYVKSLVIYFYLKNREFNIALPLIENLKKEAIVKNDSIPLAECYTQLGNLYTRQERHFMAIQYYEKALEIYTLLNNKAYMAYINISIGDAYRRFAKTKEALLHFQKAALDCQVSQDVKAAYYNNALVSIGVCDFELGKQEEMDRLYHQLKPHGSNLLTDDRDMYLLLEAYHFVFHKEYDKALTLADSISLWPNQVFLKEQLYKTTGNYPKMYEYARLHIQITDSIQQKIDFYRSQEVKSMVNMERIKGINDRLELKNARLELENRRTTLILVTLLLCVIAIGCTIYIIKRNTLVKALTEEKAVAENAQIEAERMRGEAISAKNEAESANSMKTVFIQNMSHEIRTPLNAIEGFSKILTDPSIELEEGERSKIADIVDSNSELLTTLINDILDLSNLSTGRYKMNLQPANILPICENAMATVKHRIPQGVEFRFEKDEDITITTDAKRVEQVLINYLTNACKYTTKGYISLKYEKRQDKIVFTVEDSGQGIPANEAERIFERFEKLDSLKQGHGLGLNICLSIAKLLNGKCWLDTTYTSGSRFCFELPFE